MCNPNAIKGLLLFGLSVKLHSHLLLTYDWEGFSHSFVLQRSRQKDVFPQISIRRELFFFFFKPQLSPSGGIQALLCWLHFPDPKTTSNYGWISTALSSIKGHRAVACPCVTCSVVVQSVYISGIFRILFGGKEGELQRKLSKKSNPSNVCAIFNGVNKKTLKNDVSADFNKMYCSLFLIALLQSMMPVSKERLKMTLCATISRCGFRLRAHIQKQAHLVHFFKYRLIITFPQ